LASLIYKRCSKDELKELFTNIDVDKMLKTFKLDGLDNYIVYDSGQCEMVNSLLVEENLPALKDYFTFCVLNSTAAYRGTKAADLYYGLQSFMDGSERQSDEKISKQATEDWLEWEFGQLYVKENFSEEDRESVTKIVEQIIDEYAKIIDRQDWMSSTTKENAKKKLETMKLKIGYPDEWPATMELDQIVPLSEGGSLLSNMLIRTELESNYNKSLIGTEANRNKWDMTPQTVNAYYYPANNEIVFPAAILQAPFYSSDNTYAQNLGGIGFVIGHELSHAFDSIGSYFDENGNYNDWWTEADRENYDKLKQEISDYYSKYQILGLNVNGVLTVGEDIADLGSVTCVASILAGDDEALKEAFTQTAFVLAFKATDSYKLNLLNIDTHAPSSVRANAALSSCDAFYKVFNINEGDGMYVAPKDRVGIWK
jgi:putative endopeptidase